MKRFLQIAVLLASTLAFFGCASKAPAPASERTSQPRVIEGSPASPAPAPVAPAETGPAHVVKKGDTLFGIALDHGLDYKDLARWNNLDKPDKILIGQKLRLTDPAAAPATDAAETDGVVVKPIIPSAPQKIKTTETAPGATPTPAPSPSGAMLKRGPKGGKQPYSEGALAALQKGGTVAVATPAVVVPPPPVVVAPPTPAPAPAPAPQPAAVATSTWTWPAAGKVSAPFVEGGNKGIDIAGKIGDPVLAASAGKVTYVGDSLRGFGKMVVVKHSGEYLSVYAHNSKILVTEGQSVSVGQKIAELGDSDAESPRLHFEIRRQGKPVDPMQHLPAR